MPKKKKTGAKAKPAGRQVVKGQSLKILAPEMVLAKELAEEDRDLRKAKVAEILEGFRADRAKRRNELRALMNDLKAQGSRRRQAMQKFMQDLRQQVLQKKKMMPEVRI